MIELIRSTGGTRDDGRRSVRIEPQEGPSLLPIAICVPARDEAAELPGLFAALDRLVRSPGQPLHLCLLLDGCGDGSVALAERYRAGSSLRVNVAVAAPSAANAGRARHRAMELGRALLEDDDGLLLTTDADSRPAPNWVLTMTAALARAEVVAGRIVRTDSRPSALQDRIEHYYDALFALRRRLDPVPWEAEETHHHSGGANLGIRAAAYHALGGFPPLASGEDARLVDEAARAGMRVRRDAACLVTTSDRRDGRCAGGLAEALRWCDRRDAAATVVAHPGDAAWQYRLHAVARDAFAAGRLGRIAAALGLSDDHAVGVARDCANAEAFAMRIVPAPPGGVRQVPLPVAEAELAALAVGAVAA